MPVEDEASEPESHSTPTLDDLYDSLSFRDNFRLFRYGIRVDNALGEIDIHAGHFNARLRRAVKIMGMREGWSPQEVAAAVSDGFFGLVPFPILERWKQQGKFRVEQLDRFSELCIRAVQAAFGCDLRDFLESPDRAKRFLHDLRNPDKLEDMLIRLEEITGESIRAKLNAKARDQDDQLLAEAGLTGASAEDIRSMQRISDETNEIIGDYGEVLEALGTEGYGFVYPLSRLPYPKSVIRDALNDARQKTPEQFAEPIETGLSCLDRFVPDEDIPEKLDTDEGIEKALEALRREHARNRRNARAER